MYLPRIEPCLKYVVIGTGRCGTGWVSKGLGFGHENVFGVGGTVRGTGWIGDCSWLAVPWLEENPDHGLTVVHLMRDPRLTVASLASTLFTYRGPWQDFAQEHCPTSGTPVERARAFWHSWTDRCVALTNDLWKVEELTLQSDFNNSRPRLYPVGEMDGACKTFGYM